MNQSGQGARSIPPRRGWILYDGECGFCFRWVRLWQNVIERRGFALKDLQSASADGSLEISPENLLDDLLVLTPSGKLKTGADAYLFVARLIGSYPTTVKSTRRHPSVENVRGRERW